MNKKRKYDFGFGRKPPSSIDYNNIIKFSSGTAMSLVDIATSIGITLTNPIVNGDEIYFDNIDYTMSIGAFSNNSNILYIKSSANIVGYNAINGLSNCNYIELPKVTYIEEDLFSGTGSNVGGATIKLPLVSQIGPTTGNNNVFSGITSGNYTLHIPSSFDNLSGGYTDGDITHLSNNANLSVVWL